MTKFLTLKEVAKIFNVSEIMVRRLMYRRKIPFFKIRRLIRFSEEDINQFLENNYWDWEKHHKIEL
jgi:excisionase family DNA binding protein